MRHAYVATASPDSTMGLADVGERGVLRLSTDNERGLPDMAKAIFGHIGGPDPRLLSEVARLRRRVVELEAEVDRLSAENQALVPDSIGGSLADDIITLDAPLPERSAPALA